MAKVLLVYVNSFMDNLIPLGTSILSACLKKAGHEVKLFDTTFYRTCDETGDEARVKTLQVKPTNLSDFGIKEKERGLVQDFKEMISDYNPDLIGISVVESTWNIATKMLDSISEINILKIVGGIHATMAPEEVIKHKGVDMNGALSKMSEQFIT